MMRTTSKARLWLLVAALSGAALQADAQDSAATPYSPDTPTSLVGGSAPLPVPAGLPRAELPTEGSLVMQILQLGDDASDAAARELARHLEPVPGGLTADEVVSKAISNSPMMSKGTIEVDRAKLQQARAKLAFIPRLDLSGTYTHLSHINPPGIPTPDVDKWGRPLETPKGPVINPLTVVETGPHATPPQGYTSEVLFHQIYNQYMAKATLAVPITDWFLTILPNYRGATLLDDVAKERRNAQELQVAYDARIAFYDYAHALGGEAVALVSVQVLENSMKDLESLVSAGASTPTNLARAKAAWENAKALAVQMHGFVVVAAERIQQMTGEPVKIERGIGEPLIGMGFPDAPSVEQVLSEAKSVRPELKALRIMEKIQHHYAQARRGSVLPKISGMANGYYANPNPRYMPPQQQWHTTWDASVVLSWSPNDALVNNTYVKESNLDINNVQEDLRNFEMQIAVESANAVTTYNSAANAIAANTEALQAARKYQVDQRSLMLAGAATPNDVLLAERDLTAAALQWVDAYINAQRAQAGLLKAQGKTGLSKDATAQKNAGTTQ